MKIKISGKEYQLDPACTQAAKKAVSEILDKAKSVNTPDGDNRFFLSVVVMMHFLSGKILEEISDEDFRTGKKM